VSFEKSNELIWNRNLYFSAYSILVVSQPAMLLCAHVKLIGSSINSRLGCDVVWKIFLTFHSHSNKHRNYVFRVVPTVNSDCFPKQH
jgi:hypothetical protein